MSEAREERINIAAWLPSPGGKIEVGPASLWSPEKGQLRIRIFAAPLTPADALFSSSTPPFKLTYPTIISSTIAGVVDLLGEGVTKVKLGDRVVSGTGIWTSRGDPKFGGLQRFGIVEESEIVAIGPDVRFDIAIGAAMQTAAGALFSQLHMALDRPVLVDNQPFVSNPANGKRVLIWGGASAMGAVSISHAVNAGYEVFTTCSPHNFAFVKSLGASQAFDYHTEDETVVAIHTLGKIDYYYDCVSLSASVAALLRLMSREKSVDGEEKVLWTLTPPSMHGNPSLPDSVKTKMILFRNGAEENKELVEWMLKRKGYLERGVREGWLRGVEGDIVGSLISVQLALERRSIPGLQGVSGRRLIVEPLL